jgi:hypothetical protein
VMEKGAASIPNTNLSLRHLPPEAPLRIANSRFRAASRKYGRTTGGGQVGNKARAMTKFTGGHAGCSPTQAFGDMCGTPISIRDARVT